MSPIRLLTRPGLEDCYTQRRYIPPACLQLVPPSGCYSCGMSAEWVQWLGTFVTISGLVVVAPYEAGRMLPDLWAAAVEKGNRARVWLARWLPSLRRERLVNAGGIATSLSGVQGSIYGRVGLSDKGTTADQLAALRAALGAVHQELDGLRADMHKTRTELTGRLDQHAQDLAQLRQAVELYRREQGEVNARGFPLAAVGALLAGLPGLFVSWWWAPLFALVLYVALRWLWDSRIRLADGWRRQ